VFGVSVLRLAKRNTINAVGLPSFKIFEEGKCYSRTMIFEAT